MTGERGKLIEEIAEKHSRGNLMIRARFAVALCELAEAMIAEVELKLSELKILRAIFTENDNPEITALEDTLARLRVLCGLPEKKP